MSDSEISSKQRQAADDNPRPHKRQRLESSSFSSPPSQAVVIKTSPLSPSSQGLAPLPPAILLISLPALLVHPPNHRYHVHSLCLSLLSIRKCLSLQSLNPDIECRAWTALVEIGMNVIGGGFSQSDEHPWAKGIEIEVEKAASKGLLLAQKHPSLRAYRPHLTLLSAQLAQWQHNSKFARNLLRRLLTTFLPSDAPHIIYSAHLGLISHLSLPIATTSTLNHSHSHTTQPSTPENTHAALSAIEDLQSLSIKNAHPSITLLTYILRLRLLVSAGMWEQVGPALHTAEDALELAYSTPAASPDSSTKPRAKNQESASIRGTANGPPTPTPTRTKSSAPDSFKTFEDPFEATMAIHTLVIGVVFHTYAGDAVDMSPRLSHLHTLLDAGALDREGSGIVQINFAGSSPLYIQTTHPRVLYSLAFLVSSVAKRDPVGRKPKRKVFAMEGLVSWEKDLRKELALPAWAGVADVQEVELRMAKIKADLLCELVGVSILRSEFDAAENNLDLLIAHTRTYDLFSSFAARITLHHAHLAHALGQPQRALECYRVAAHLAEDDAFVRVSARTGEVAMRLGMRRGNDGVAGRTEDCPEETDSMAEGVAEACRGMGGTLRAVGQVIEACLSKEILKAKQHLKQALEYATKSQDNHLRALILALISSHYFHTSGEHAQSMLSTCEQLASGLGASASKSKTPGDPGGDTVGNAVLRHWVGERFLELHKRAGNESRAQKQAVANRQLSKAVERITQRGLGSGFREPETTSTSS